MVGWESNQLIGRSAYDLFHPDDLARIAENHAKHVDASDAGAVEYRLRAPDGGYRWVCTHSTNCKDPGGVPQIVAFTRDISEQRARQERLEAMIAELRSGPAISSEHIRVCAWCRQIAGADGWMRLEAYLTELTGRSVSHGICTSCADTLKA